MRELEKRLRALERKEDKHDLKEMEKKIGKLEKGMERGLASGKKKTKRKPSKYNIYMKKEIGNIKKKNPGMSHEEAFKAVANLWKLKK